MGTPSEKLAQSLKALKILQDTGVLAIRSRDLTRTHRQRLLANGFIREVMKGWYIASRPAETAGESSAWYASYWAFCAAYLQIRFGDAWCLSPEQSLMLHGGNWTVPQQLLVRAPEKGSNKSQDLMCDTSLFTLRIGIPGTSEIEIKEGLRVFSLSAALVQSAPGCYRQDAIDVRTALSMISDASAVLPQLLGGGHTRSAGRLVGAFRNIGRERIADDILKTMRAADHEVREIDPFAEKLPFNIATRETSPYVNRIRLMWQMMRESIQASELEVTAQKIKFSDYLKNVDDIYVTDAYHSLSIEGYQVTLELINKVKEGNWRPDTDAADQELHNALAARGYWEAFQLVKESVAKVLQGEEPGDVVDHSHADWYRSLFAPSVVAGIIKPADLAGYRNRPVYIKQSRHVPPNYEAVRELMPVFYDLLKDEVSAESRIILGHFIFVFIHPYVDGNGRMARFLMNVMRAAAGYPWLVIPVEERDHYMKALEEASVKQNVLPFTKFIARLDGMK
jgi:Fic family protein